MTRSCLVLVSFGRMLAGELAEECTMNLQAQNFGESMHSESAELPSTDALIQRSKEQGAALADLSDALKPKREQGSQLRRPEVPGMCNITQHSVNFKCSYDQFGPFSQRRGWLSSALTPPQKHYRVGPRPAGSGSVAAMYVAGAPRPSACPMVDELREDCVFEGLRVVTRDSGDGYDPVTLSSNLAFNHRHPLIRAMELQIPDVAGDDITETLLDYHEAQDEGKSFRHICTKVGCHMAYWDWFFGPGAKVNSSARHILSITPYAVRGPFERPRPGWNFAQAGIAPDKLGFRPIGIFSEHLSFLDTDGAMLYQDDDNACFLSFSQTGPCLSDWITNFNTVSSAWCAAEEVHNGWARELRRILSHPLYDCEIRRNLPSCASVTVTGFSMGGAMAELFSFCANRQMPAIDDPDFGLVTWTEGNVTRLPDYDPKTCL